MYNLLKDINDSKTMNSLNWIGLIALIIGLGCFGLIGFKRTVLWGPTKSIMDELDLAEKRFVKIELLWEDKNLIVRVDGEDITKFSEDNLNLYRKNLAD